jgi:hypothetical protein
MNLQTPVPNPTNLPEITHQDYLLLSGSCFAENMGRYFAEYKFPAKSNLTGIAYNPLSLFRLIDYSLEHMQPPADEFTERDERFFHFDFHSSLASGSMERSKELIQKALKQQLKWLQKSKVIFLSLGTAWVYEQKETGQLVNNCHKQPAKLFTRRLLTVDEMKDAWKGTWNSLKKINDEVKVIFTISPVRHIKDGFRENQLSKGLLHQFVDQLLKEYPEDCFYYPAYEIMLDELRDYRFYDKDFLHPNQLATDFIWEKLSESIFSAHSRELNKAIRQLRSNIAHRAFDPGSESYQQHLRQTMDKAIAMQKQHEINLSKELQKIKRRMKLA